MYAPGTILRLKEQRAPTEKLDRDTGEPVLKGPKGREKPVMLEFPYNRVRVIGRSPVSYTNDWSGADAVGVIITPLTDFAGNLDEPFGKLNQLYEVESIPERKVPEKIEVKIIDAATNEAGPTPEEVFAREAPGKPPAPGQVRGRTDPFGDVKPPSQSPL
jgi:hypothetical protein